jgi:hypothetical protein
MFLDFLKDIFSSPDSAFQKLTPEYFIQQRMKMPIREDYAKWLLKQEVYYLTMARIEKEDRQSVPQSWINGLRLIDAEKEKLGPQLKPKTDIEPLPSRGNKWIEIIVAGIVILLFAASFGFKALKLFDTVTNDKVISAPVFLEKINTTRDYSEKKQYSEMLSSAEKALQAAKTDKEKAEAHYYISLSYYKLYNVDLFEKEMKKAIELEDHYTLAYLTLFSYYAFSDRLDDLKVLMAQYLNKTGKSKETLEKEINANEWISDKDKILKIINELE